VSSDDDVAGSPFPSRGKNLLGRMSLTEKMPRFRGESGLALGTHEQLLALGPEGIQQHTDGSPSFGGDRSAGVYHEDQGHLRSGEPSQLSTGIQGLRRKRAFVDRDENAGWCHNVIIGVLREKVIECGWSRPSSTLVGRVELMPLLSRMHP
jgi:hypothetical protein